MDTSAVIVLSSLASYRIWRLVAKDDIAARPRARLLTRWGFSHGDPFARAWTCHWCTGSLITFAVVGAMAQVVSIRLPVLVALASATVAGIIGEKFDGD